MAEESNPNPPSTPPVTDPPKPPDTGNDPVAMAKRLGELEAENKRITSEYKEYKGRVDPVIETLWADQELLSAAEKAHRKRLGIKDDTTPSDKSDDTTPPPPPPGDPKARKALNERTTTEFMQKNGLDKLDATKQKETLGLVGQMIKNMVDPQNNKTVDQALNDIDPDRFGWYLENAYAIINKEQDRQQAIEEGKKIAMGESVGNTGAIGSMTSGSIDPDTITLSPREKSVAKAMGVTEEAYLKNKKKIIEMRNAPEV